MRLAKNTEFLQSDNNIQLTSGNSASLMQQVRIPVEFGHLFRFISDTRSDLIRTVIPIQFGHLFRFYSDSDSGMNSDRF